MTCPLRHMNTSMRPFVSMSRAIWSRPTVLQGMRGYAQKSSKWRPKQQGDREPARQQRRPPASYPSQQRPSTSSTSEPSSSSLSSHTSAEEERIPVDEKPSSEASLPTSDAVLLHHLNGLFPQLEFRPELARRMLTHASHPAAVHGHNAGLAFLGRRVLESYLVMFLNSSSALKPTHEIILIMQRTLNTYVLGEHVGSAWGLGRVMRWSPTAPLERLDASQDKEVLLKSVGLYKVQGEAVEAVIGGIFRQFGASVAHRVFHTRFLPNLLLKKPEGLPDAFHADARATCERMGGTDGDLLSAASQQQQQPHASSSQSQSSSSHSPSPSISSSGSA